MESERSVLYFSLSFFFGFDSLYFIFLFFFIEGRLFFLSNFFFKSSGLPPGCYCKKKLSLQIDKAGGGGKGSGLRREEKVGRWGRKGLLSSIHEFFFRANFFHIEKSFALIEFSYGICR